MRELLGLELQNDSGLIGWFTKYIDLRKTSEGHFYQDSTTVLNKTFKHSWGGGDNKKLHHSNGIQF